MFDKAIFHSPWTSFLFLLPFVVLVADHPLLAAIEDSESGSLLFLCRIIQP